MEYIKRIKNLVALALYIMLIVFFTPKELREYAIIAVIVSVSLFVLLLILLSEPYRIILLKVTWAIVTLTFILLAIHLYQQNKIKQQAEQEQDY